MAYLLLSLSALFWSGNFVLSRAVNTLIPPVGLNFWRWAVALTLLAPVALPKMRQQWPLVRKSRGFIILSGLLGVTLFNLLIYSAMHTTTAINAVLINSVVPVFIIALSRLFYGVRMTSRQWFGIALSLTGVVVIVLRGEAAAAAALALHRGDVQVLVAALAWAIYSVRLRHYPDGLDPFVFLFAITLCGLVMLAPLYAWEMAQGEMVRPTPATLASIAYVGVFASVAAFVAWNAGIRRVGAQIGGQFIHLMPVFSTLLAMLFLGERLHLFHLAGIALIVAGIFFATRGRRG
jgi:drug/metabolite transporter (DMT)-like permease